MPKGVSVQPDALLGNHKTNSAAPFFFFFERTIFFCVYVNAKFAARYVTAKMFTQCLERRKTNFRLYTSMSKF